MDIKIQQPKMLKIATPNSCIPSTNDDMIIQREAINTDKTFTDISNQGIQVKTPVSNDKCIRKSALFLRI